MWATGDRNAFVSWRYLCFFKSLLAIGAVCLGTAGLAVAQGQIHLPPLVSQGPEAGRVPVVTTEQQERERGYKVATGAPRTGQARYDQAISAVR